MEKALRLEAGDYIFEIDTLNYRRGPCTLLKRIDNAASGRDRFLKSLPHPFVTTHPSCGTPVHVCYHPGYIRYITHLPYSNKPGNKISGAQLVLPGCTFFRLTQCGQRRLQYHSNDMHSDSQSTVHTHRWNKTIGSCKRYLLQRILERTNLRAARGRQGGSCFLRKNEDLTWFGFHRLIS